MLEREFQGQPFSVQLRGLDTCKCPHIILRWSMLQWIYTCMYCRRFVKKGETRSHGVFVVGGRGMCE